MNILGSLLKVIQVSLNEAIRFGLLKEFDGLVDHGDGTIEIGGLGLVGFRAFLNCCFDVGSQNLGGFDFPSFFLKEIFKPQAVVLQGFQIIIMLGDLILILGNLVAVICLVG